MAATEATQIVISAVDKTREAFQSVERNIDSLKTGAANIDALAGKLPLIGAGLTAAFGAVSFTGIVTGAIAAEGALYDLALQSGSTVETLSAMKMPAKLANTSLEDVAKTIQKLSISIGEARLKGGDKATLLKAMGIDPASVTDSGVALFDLAKKFDSMEDKTKALSAARDLLGKQVSMPFLQQLAEEERLVAKVTTAQAAQAKQYEDNMIRLRSGAGQVGIALANATLPAMNDILNFSLEIKKEWGTIAGIMFGIGGGTMLKLLGFEVDPLKRAGQEATDAFKNLADARKKLSEAQEASKRSDANYIPGLADFRQSRVREAEKSVADAEKVLRSAIARNNKLQEDAAREAESRRNKKPYTIPDGALAGAKAESDYDKLAKSLREKIAMQDADLASTEKITDATREYYKLLADIKNGYVNLTAKQKNDVFALSFQSIKNAELIEDKKKALEQRAGMRAGNEQIVDLGRHFDRENADRQAKMNLMPESRRQLLLDLNKVEESAQRVRDHFGKMLADGKLSQAGYDELMGKLNTAIGVQSEKVQALSAAQKDLNSSWQYGAEKSLQAYLDQVENVAESTGQAMTRGFGMAEDALTSMVQHGKLDLKSLADYAESEFIRLTLVRPAVAAGAEAVKGAGGMSGLLSSAGSFIGSLFGGFKASGGPLEQGKWYIAGEHGPEPVWGGGPGAFATGYGSGGGAAQSSVTIVQNFYPAAGVSQADLAPLLLASKNAAVAEVHNAMRRGVWQA